MAKIPFSCPNCTKKLYVVLRWILPEFDIALMHLFALLPRLKDSISSTNRNTNLRIAVCDQNVTIRMVRCLLPNSQVLRGEDNKYPGKDFRILTFGVACDRL